MKLPSSFIHESQLFRAYTSAWASHEGISGAPSWFCRYLQARRRCSVGAAECTCRGAVASLGICLLMIALAATVAVASERYSNYTICVACITCVTCVTCVTYVTGSVLLGSASEIPRVVTCVTCVTYVTGSALFGSASEIPRVVTCVTCVTYVTGSALLGSASEILRVECAVVRQNIIRRELQRLRRLLTRSAERDCLLLLLRRRIRCVGGLGRGAHRHRILSRSVD